MVELLQNGYLSDGRRGNALFLMFKPDLLDGNDSISVPPATSVHHSIGTLSNLFKIVELQASIKLVEDSDPPRKGQAIMEADKTWCMFTFLKAYPVLQHKVQACLAASRRSSELWPLRHG